MEANVADSKNSLITQKSKEQVAFDLLEMVMGAEGRVAHKPEYSGETQADRQYILETYHECWRVVQGSLPK